MTVKSVISVRSLLKIVNHFQFPTLERQNAAVNCASQIAESRNWIELT